MDNRGADQLTRPFAQLGGGAFLIALAAFASLPTTVTANESPALSQDKLIEFAQLCDSTASADHDAFATAAETLGFRQVTSIQSNLDAFFATREASFSYRDDTNPIMFNSTDAMLATPTADAPTSFFAGQDRWVAILRSPTPLATMNGIEVGEGHVCQFFGYGWINEPDAEAALANFGGEDFAGRGNILPGPDWGYLFSGTQRGPYPKTMFMVTAVYGTPDAVPPTINIEYVVAYDMTIPPEVLETQ